MVPEEGTTTISSPAAESPVPASGRGGPVEALRIHPGGALFELPTDRARITLGTSAGCGVSLSDPYVSKLHCVLERKGPRLLVRDRWSKNGSFLDGHRVEVAEVRPGALLRVGRTTLMALTRQGRRRRSAFERLLGEDAHFKAALHLAERAAATDCSVLLIGETGTGKDLLARAIHEASARSAGPFVPLNCGGIPRQLISSELFGHLRGSFTGAVADHPGVFVEADGGTLFLDELAELPLEEQPHLLRALEHRTVRPVGATFERDVDVRLIAATNRFDVGSEGGSLRPDLYHRVATVVIEIPPLRARRRDVPLLARAFMEELAPRYGARSISEATLRALGEYPWPGNVRELRHAVQRAVALGADEVALDMLLPQICRPDFAETIGRTLRRDRMRLHAGEAAPWLLTASSATYDDVVRELMKAALERHGTIRRAAASLGIPKSTFADRARRLGVKTGPDRG